MQNKNTIKNWKIEITDEGFAQQTGKVSVEAV